MEGKQCASPAQCRAARALLKWTQRDLAQRAHVSRKTVADFEAGISIRRLHLRTRVDITRTLQAAGVEFTSSDAGEGVSCACEFAQVMPIAAATRPRAR